MAVGTNCDQLTQNLIADWCEKSPESGFLATMYVIPYNSINRTTSTRAGQQLTELLLKAGSPIGRKLVGKDYSNEMAAEMVKGTFFDRWKHSVPFKILEDSAAADEWLHSLANTKVVVVLVKNTAPGNETSGFLVAGFDRGLKVMTATANWADADTGGAWDVKLESDEKALEPRSPLRYIKTDAAVTLAALEAICTATP